MVASITPNFSQGTISTSTTPSDLAIQGDGMFIMQGSNGQQLYTRNGEFTDERQQPVGQQQRLQPAGLRREQRSFNINSTTLQPLSIPLGTATVAQATQNVILEGSLPPADTASPTRRRSFRPAPSATPSTLRPAMAPTVRQRRRRHRSPPGCINTT